MNSVTLPLTPLDSRSIGMGGTGVASARTGHAVSFNPALMSLADSDEDFSFIIPQLGATSANEDELFESANEFVDANYIEKFTANINSARQYINNITQYSAAIDTALTEANYTQLQQGLNSLNENAVPLREKTLTIDSQTNALIKNLSALDNKVVRGKLGGGITMAFPSQDFSMAFTMSTETDFSGFLTITDSDLSTLDIYSDAAVLYSEKLLNYSNASSDLLEKATNLGNAIAAGDSDALPRLGSELLASQFIFFDADNEFKSFNYGGNATPTDDNDGDKVIFTKGELASDADDIELSSSGQFVAVTTTEFGWSFAKRFNQDGNSFSIGLTPKMVQFELYDYIYRVNENKDIKFDDILDTKTVESSFNLDIGYAQKFGATEQWTFGLVVKNIIKREYQTQLGEEVVIEPQARIGLSYRRGLLTLAADYDLSKNRVVAFGDATQYAMVGAEVDLLRFMQLRAGYRTDLINTDFDSYSLGIGLSALGLHIDLSAFVNTTDIDNEAGVSMEFGFEW